MLSQRDGYQLTDEISVRSGLRDDRPMQYAGRTLQRESKKTRRQTLGHNFTNYYPIFNFFSPADSVVNLQQTRV